MKKLPIGIQDFKEIITGGYIYIDKTRYLYDLVDNGKFFFISRPRRFGKSLTISTLNYLFKGEKELFKGTYIYDKWEFVEYPVIKISMTEVDSSDASTVEETLRHLLLGMYRENDIFPRSENIKMMFADLIKELSHKGKVVLLIDEYEKPILDHLKDKDKAEPIRELLRNFYQVIKDADPYLKFVLMTGITKFTKTGVFSTLNNLNELTTDEKYSQMMGYTQDELEFYFTGYIDRIVLEKGRTREEIMSDIKDYYNGFSFDGIHFMYNPFSILNYFSKGELKNYWVESGSPSFMVQYAKNNNIKIDNLLGRYIQETDISTYEIEQAPPINFLLQSGYLTFKDKHDQKGFLVDFPNMEVRDSFSKLIMLGSYNISQDDVNGIRNAIIDGFEDRDFDKIFVQMKRTFSNIPYNLYDKKESYYHSVLLTLLWACGLNVTAEERSNLGASDLVIKHRGEVYVIELKKSPAVVSLEQIKSKGYCGKYIGQRVTLVGIEIDEDTRNLKEYLIEVLT